LGIFVFTEAIKKGMLPLSAVSISLSAGARRQKHAGNFKKMIAEAMTAHRADVNQIKKKLVQNFVIEDTRAYVDAVT